MKETPSILVIYTGGTIGMVESPDTHVLAPFNFQDLKSQVPEISKLPVKLSTHAFEKPLDSSDMDPAVWAEIAGVMQRSYHAYDGFVVLHGSDTLSFTASALSFMLEGLDKPVILTGSQLPIGMIRTDGKENFITAIEVAATQGADGPKVREVAIYFEYKLYRGNRTRKVSAEAFEAFVSPNYPVLAEAGVHLGFNDFALLKNNAGPFRVHTGMDTNVGALTLFPGISESFVNAVLGTPGMKALVLQTFGAGNATTKNWFVSALQKAIANGLIVVNVTQCYKGRVEQGRYATSATLKEIGVVSGLDITFEAAITKLMYLLGKYEDREQAKLRFQENLRGEMTAA